MEEESLTPAMLAAKERKEKAAISKEIFPKILEQFPLLCGWITGLVLEKDLATLRNLVADSEALQNAILEAKNTAIERYGERQSLIPPPEIVQKQQEHNLKPPRPPPSEQNSRQTPKSPQQAHTPKAQAQKPAEQTPKAQAQKSPEQTPKAQAQKSAEQAQRTPERDRPQAKPSVEQGEEQSPVAPEKKMDSKEMKELLEQRMAELSLAPQVVTGVIGRFSQMTKLKKQHLMESPEALGQLVSQMEQQKKIVKKAPKLEEDQEFLRHLLLPAIQRSHPVSTETITEFLLQRRKSPEILMLLNNPTLLQQAADEALSIIAHDDFPPLGS